MKFVDSKTLSLFTRRKNPRKLHWTTAFRKAHKKGITVEAAKKKTKKTVKAQRGIVGLSIDEILARRNQKPEEREAIRQKAIEQAKAKAAKKKTEAPKV